MAAQKRSSIADTLPTNTRQGLGRPSKSTLVKDTLTNGEEPKRNRRTTIYLTEDNWKAMKFNTIETGESVSAYIERLIEKDMKRAKNK